MRVGFLIDLHYFDLGRIRHFPLAIRVRLSPNIPACSLISVLVIDCTGQVVSKWFLANIPADRARVEWIRGVVGSLIPIEEGPCRHFHLPGRENAPEYLNRIAPRHRYGPGSGLVIADGLLHKPGRVELHRRLEPPKGLDSAHIWKYGLYYIQVMEGDQWCNRMGC